MISKFAHRRSCWAVLLAVVAAPCLADDSTSSRKVYCRETGSPQAPSGLLLHGYSTASHMSCDLIPALADRDYVVASGYPRFGSSSEPLGDQFDYPCGNLAAVVSKFFDRVGSDRSSLYLMDDGAFIGFAIAAAAPGRVDALVIENGDACDERINNDFWILIKHLRADRATENDDALRSLPTLDAMKWQYTPGVRNVDATGPDAWRHAQPILERPSDQKIQLDVFVSYGSNPPLYLSRQADLRKHQPPTLIVWKKPKPSSPTPAAIPSGAISTTWSFAYSKQDASHLTKTGPKSLG